MKTDPSTLFALFFFSCIINLPTCTAINEVCSNDEYCSDITIGPVYCNADWGCQCKNNYIPVKLHGSYRDHCVLISFARPGSECEHSEQCRAAMGYLTRCFRGECQCYDVPRRGRNETVFARDRCIYKKSVGSTCVYDEECENSLGRFSACGEQKTCTDPLVFTANNGCRFGFQHGMNWFQMLVLYPTQVKMSMNALVLYVMNRLVI